MKNTSHKNSSWSSALQGRLQSGGSVEKEINWNNKVGYSVDFIKRLEHLLVHKRPDDEKPSKFSDQSRKGMFSKELVLEVEKYQNEKGLNDVDGKIGDETLDSLKWTYPSLNEGLVGDGIVDRIIIPNNTNESDLYDYLENLVIERLGEWKSDKMEVNLVSVRGLLNGKQVENIPDKFNDTLFAAFIDENGQKCIEQYVISVDPGIIKHPKSEKAKKYGLAHLKDGTYIYLLDYHNRKAPPALEKSINARENENRPIIDIKGGRYQALRAKHDSVRVYRDEDRDDVVEKGEKEDTGNCINVHCSWNKTKVGTSSEGCQIIKDPEDYINFILVIESSINKKDIPYTIVDASKIKAM